MDVQWSSKLFWPLLFTEKDTKDIQTSTLLALDTQDRQISLKVVLIAIWANLKVHIHVNLNQILHTIGTPVLDALKSTHNDLFLWETIFQDINIKLLVQPSLLNHPMKFKNRRRVIIIFLHAWTKKGNRKEYFQHGTLYH